MFEQSPSDFTQGYNYARQLYDQLINKHNASELLELAKIFSEFSGGNAELARGMAACCEEAARLKLGQAVLPEACPSK